VLLLVASMPVMSAATLHDSSEFVGLLDLIRTSANGWSVRLQDFARSLFWSLALIQFVITFGFLTLKGADFTELLAELVRYVLITGFFASMLIFSVQWSEAIVNSFRQAAASASGLGIQLHPGDVLSLGVQFAEKISDVEMWNPLTAFLCAMCAIIVLMCFTFIAAFMAITLVESYIVINASVLFMAFGATQWTREYAISILRWSLSVGAKLFVLTLLVGLGMTVAHQWQLAYRNDQTSTFVLACVCVLFAALVKTLPDLIQGLIQGVSPGGGSVLGGMAAAAAAGGVAGAAYVAQKIGASNILSGTGGGIASAISSSLSGGGSGNSPAPSMTSSSSGSSNAPSGPPWRLGGGATPGAAPSSPSTPPSAPSSGGGSKVAGAAHAAVAGAVRASGVMASMAVPGMEGAESLSVGSPTPPIDTELPQAAQSTPENIIRPEAQAPETPEAQSTVDTMSSLKEALNNRGKRS
jgi:type IV secretion system protein TrbL